MSWLEGGKPVGSSWLGEDEHEIIFVFDLTGLNDPSSGKESVVVSANPFTDQTWITFSKAVKDNTVIRVYTSAGKQVRSLIARAGDKSVLIPAK